MVLSRPWVHLLAFWQLVNSVGDLACFVGPSVLAVVGCPVSCVSVSCVLVLLMQSPKVRNGASLGTRIGGACNHEFLATHVWPPKVQELVDQSRLCAWAASARQANVEAARKEQTRQQCFRESQLEGIACAGNVNIPCSSRTHLLDTSWKPYGRLSQLR